MKAARLLALFVFLLWAQPARAQSPGRTLIVAPEGPYATLAAALSDAEAGDRVEVRGGEHPGPLVVDQSVELIGMDGAAIDGGGEGTVVKLLAPNIVFAGFTVRNSGDSLDQENSGIAGEAPNLHIENNHLVDTLFGIYLREAPGTVIRGNLIQSKDLDVPRRGDPIRVWYSDHVVIENNQVELGRDVVLWYSNHLTIVDNKIQGGRYGLHFMYCDDADIRGNLLVDNSVGAFLMYSRRMHLRGNTIANNRGPSGFGVGLKDMDDAVVEDNLFYDNRIGAHLDNSPREVDGLGWFEGNTFSYNDIGVNMMPSVRHNQFSDNNFIDNGEQVSIAGGGQLLENDWTVGGRGNYWSDYAGYDAAGDGLGDEPYLAERLFENLVDRYPVLRLFAFSPSADAVDFAAEAVPLVRPKPKLTDDNPLMDPILLHGLPVPPRANAGAFGWTSALMVGLGAAVLLVARVHFQSSARSAVRSGPRERSMIRIKNLTKKFGTVVAVDDLSLTIDAGEAVALWGPNGAGKTTVLHCVLGLIPHQGVIEVAGMPIGSDGREVRSAIGFVPQQLNFYHELGVEETLQFYASLKKAGPESVQSVIDQLDIGAYQSKRVGELSGGMKQRLALALALLSDPALLILDEPTASLDIDSRAELIKLLAGLKAAGKTLLFSSHRLDEVMELADRVIALRQGRLAADSPPQDFARAAGLQARMSLLIPNGHMSEAVRILEGRGFVVTPNGKRIGVRVNSDQKAEPISALTQAGIKVSDFQVEMAEEGHPGEP